MMKSIIFNKTRFNCWKKRTSEGTFEGPTTIKATPKSKAKKMICSILELSPKALKRFSGTMSTTNCKGDSSFTCCICASRSTTVCW